MSDEKKKRVRNNQRVLNNFNNYQNNKFKKNSSNTAPVPLEIEDEIDVIAKKLLKLKGDKKSEYLNEIMYRDDSIDIAKGLVITFGKILDSYISSNKEIVQVYREQIQLLHARLNKINETENPIEINNIYEQLNDITNKIQTLQKGQQNLLGALAIVITGIVGVALKSRFKKY